MVEGAALEKRWAERSREFESLPLRLDMRANPKDEPEFKQYLAFHCLGETKCR